MSKKLFSSRIIYGYLDLNRNEVRNAAIHNLGSAPSSPTNGQVYFNTISSQFYVWDGTQWVTFYPTTITLDQIAAPTGDVSLNGNKITNLATPTNAADAVTKAYADNLSAGISWKTAVRVATTANGTLASAFQNGQTVDGVTLATNDRILIKNQSTGSENGIYVVQASGAPVRATDADSAAEILQAAVFVSEGTANADTAWVCSTNAPITIGSTSLTFVQFNGGSAYTFTSGVQQVGSVVSAKVDGTTIQVNGSQQLTIVPGSGGVARKFVDTITGNGVSVTFTITHNFNTKDVIVQMRGTTAPNTDEDCDADFLKNNVNSIDVVFATAPANGVNFAVTVIG